MYSLQDLTESCDTPVCQNLYTFVTASFRYVAG